MANLLPQRIKKKYRKEYLYRTVVSWLMLVAFILGVLSVLLVPTYISLKAKHETLAAEFVVGDSDGEVQTDEIVDTMRTYTELLKKDTSSRKIPYGIFAHLYNMKDGTIEFTRMAFSGAEGTVNISGVANTRQDLFDFYSLFESDTVFEPIGDYPFESLGQAENIKFTFVLNLKEESDE